MDPSSENRTDKHAREGLPSATELFSSAQAVAEAAQASFQGGSDKVDKGKVAGALSGLLGAASHYGKLEEKSYGEYVEKAETYLEQYSSTGSATAPAAPAAATDAPPSAPAAATDTPAPSAPADGEANSSASAGGAEGLFKAAEGFLKGF